MSKRIVLVSRRILIYLVFLLVGFVIGYLASLNQRMPVTTPDSPSQSMSVTPTVSTSPSGANVQASTKEEITSLINKFEEYNKKKDSFHIMTLFTPPKSQEESDAYIYLTGIDFPSPMFRPYSLANWNFMLDSFKIISILPSNNPPIAEVEEKRSRWDNTGGRWVPETTENRIFEFRKLDYTILIDKYYVKGEKNKYGGFYQGSPVDKKDKPTLIQQSDKEFYQSFLESKGLVSRNQIIENLTGKGKQYIFISVGEGCGSCHYNEIHIFDGRKEIFTFYGEDTELIPITGKGFTITQPLLKEGQSYSERNEFQSATYTWIGDKFVRTKVSPNWVDTLQTPG